MLLEFSQENGNLNVSAVLRDARNREDAWSERFSASEGAWHELVTQLGSAVVEAMGEKGFPGLDDETDDAAWLPYLDGLDHLGRFEFSLAAKAFDRSLQADPDYVDALVAGRAYGVEPNRAGTQIQCPS